MAPTRPLTWPRFLLVLTICTQCTFAAFPQNVPIGAIFSDQSREETTAFRNRLDMLNKAKDASFKIVSDPKIVDTSNSFNMVNAVCSQIKRGSGGVYAIFGMYDMPALDAIQAYSRNLQISFITPSYPPAYSKRSDFVVYMRPNLARPLVDLINQVYKWSSFTYVYDDDEGLSSLEQVMDLVQMKDTEVIARKLYGVDNANATITTIDGEGERKVIIDLDRRTTEIFLKKISERNMWTSYYHYIFMNLDFHLLNKANLTYGQAKVTSFQIVDPLRDDRKDFQKIGKNIGFKAALTYDAAGIISTAFNSLKKDGADINLSDNTSPACEKEDNIWRFGDGIRSSLKKVKTMGVTGWVEFDRFGRRQNYTVHCLELQSRQMIPVWRWRNSKLTKVEVKVTAPTSQTPLRDRVLRVTSIFEPPYLMNKSAEDMARCPPNKVNCQYEGYAVDMLEEIAKIVNFTYKIHIVADGVYGSENETTGKWNGMVGELIEGKADLAVAPLTITLVRERVIDFSKPYTSTGISIMIKKPQKSKPGVFSFLDPLAYEIWMCILFAYIGVSVVLFLVSRFSPYEWHPAESCGVGSEDEEQTNDFGIWNSLWFSLGAFMQQGCDISPRSISGRIVGGVWWFFTLIIISSYTANLAAFLTVERMVTPIESADDLAKQTEIRYGIVKSGSTEAFFKSSTIPVYQKMWNFMSKAEPSPLMNNNNEGITNVRQSKGKYAFLLESAINDYIAQRKPCDTIKTGSNLDSKGYGIGMPKESPWRHKITLAVLKLREDGKLQNLENKWWYDKGECGPVESTKKGETSALSLSNVAGVFYILVGGLGLAMMAALLEFCYKSKVEANKSKVKNRMSVKGENGRVPSPTDPFPKSMSSVPITRPSGVSLYEMTYT
ncbi:glutamate receptor 4-like [Branchiostoma lanceolatum]|uniref:glutamate receptor 4-like n=1 Tax=Branchiostoma lanceolatum TaxID=7740 RepID=UPI003454EF40